MRCTHDAPFRNRSCPARNPKKNQHITITIDKTRISPVYEQSHLNTFPKYGNVHETAHHKFWKCCYRVRTALRKLKILKIFILFGEIYSGNTCSWDKHNAVL